MARKTWRTVEPLHAWMIYFVPEGAEAYAALGITGRDGYFASRSARRWKRSQAEVVISTFFNFNPQLVPARLPAGPGPSPRPEGTGGGALRSGGPELSATARRRRDRV